jgi:hypothetical protein
MRISGIQVMRRKLTIIFVFCGMDATEFSFWVGIYHCAFRFGAFDGRDMATSLFPASGGVKAFRY